MTATRPVNLVLIGVTAIVTLLLVGGVAVALLDLVAEDERRSTRALGTVDRLDIEADDGDITVVAAPAGTPARLETIERAGVLGGPDVTVRAEGGRVRATSDCDQILFGGRCSVRMVLHVPAGTPVRARSGAGDVELLGVRAGADVRTGSGDVRVDGASGDVLLLGTGSGDIELRAVRAERLEADTGSGDIEARGTAIDDVRLDTSSGDIDLTARTAPARLDAQTGSGDVTLGVPGGPFAIAADTGSGDEDIAVPQDPSARSRMKLSTGSGDIAVRPR